MSDCAKRCTGHCCEDFSLPVSPMQLQHEGKRARLFGKSRFSRDEIIKISEMVVFLYEDYTDSNRKGRSKPKNVTLNKASCGRVYHYTCKHFDPKTRNCTNYENRPDMCRGYPYGSQCTYRGCTYQPAAIPSLVWKTEEKKEMAG
jgi:Fe-S-cluster containining protein